MGSSASIENRFFLRSQSSCEDCVINTHIQSCMGFKLIKISASRLSFLCILKPKIFNNIIIIISPVFGSLIRILISTYFMASQIIVTAELRLLLFLLLLLALMALLIIFFFLFFVISGIRIRA